MTKEPAAAGIKVEAKKNILLYKLFFGLHLTRRPYTISFMVKHLKMGKTNNGKKCE